jgi:glycosyltransferase involved in cell wall biosynthesis
MATTGKLLSINKYHYRRGGAEAVYFDHAALFESLGWENAFFSMQHPKNEPCDQQEYFVEEIELGHLYGLQEKITKAAKIVYSFEARSKLAALLQEFSPDIAHVHSVYHQISPSILPLLKQRGIPVVLTAHDLKILCPAYTMLSNGRVCEACKGGKVWNVAMRKCIKGSVALSSLIALEAMVHGALKSYSSNVDRVVTPSRFYRDKFIEWGWPASQLLYVPNYVDASQFEPEYGRGEYFFYFGRLVRDKGVHTLIRSAADADVPLLIAGTGPHVAEFKELAANLGARVKFLGFRSGDGLHDLIRNARAVVLPSEWYENAPISLLEAYAFGTPVIGADIGGIPEMISAGETGWLFESGSTESLIQVLNKVNQLSEGELAAAGRAARHHVERHYTPAIYQESMQQLYSELR